MKLKTTFVELDAIRKKIEAELVPYQSTNTWEKIDKQKILEQLRSREGLEVKIEDISFETGISKYNGKVVLMYIRDQHAYNEDGEKREYKFHFAQCQTLSSYIQKGKYNRYVVIDRRDGIFVVNLLHNNECIAKGKEIEMKPCKNCLKKTNYKGYGKRKTSGRYYKSKSYKKGKQIDIYNDFDIKEFFEIYTHQEVIKPRYTPETAPMDGIYHKDWSDISKKKKENEKYRCEECKINFQAHKNFLQTHHIDNRPGNNNPGNLKTLCVCCHAEQGGIGHERLKTQANYRLCSEFRKKMAAK